MAADGEQDEHAETELKRRQRHRREKRNDVWHDAAHADGRDIILKLVLGAYGVYGLDEPRKHEGRAEEESACVHQHGQGCCLGLT